MIDPMSLRTQAGVHEITEGVSVEWIADGRILVSTLDNAKRTTLDAFRDMHLHIFSNWSAGDGFFELVDITSPLVTSTPYMRETSGVIFRATREAGLGGQVIFLQAKGSPFNPIMHTLINLHSRLNGGKLPNYFTTDRAKAIRTLEKLAQAWGGADDAVGGG